MTEETPTPKRRPGARVPTSAPTPPPVSSAGLPVVDGMVTLPDARLMPLPEFAERLALLSSPFGPDQIEKLPKILKSGDRDYMACQPGTGASADGHHCGGRHPRAVHLDYVGHAGITDRLVAVDPLWDWEFLFHDDNGRPIYNLDGAWITLTVLGITRKGFGDAAGKSGPNAVKELIGDALRNAAMRFGVGTYLWSKSAESRILKAGGAIDESPAPAAPAPAQRANGQRPARPAAEEKSAPQAPAQEPEPKVPAVDPAIVDDLRTRIIATVDRYELGTDRDPVLRNLWAEVQAQHAEHAEVYVPAPWHGVAGGETCTLAALVRGGRIITIDSGEGVEDDEPRADMSDDPWAIPAPDDTEGA